MSEASDDGLVSPQLVRFVIVGLSNLVLSYTVFWLSLRVFGQFALRGTASQLVTYAVGTGWSYFWNRRWTFQSDKPVAGEATRFVLLQLSLMVASTALIGVAVDWLTFNETLSWVVVMGVITVANYTLSKLWVFAKPQP